MVLRGISCKEQCVVQQQSPTGRFRLSAYVESPCSKLYSCEEGGYYPFSSDKENENPSGKRPSKQNQRSWKMHRESRRLPPLSDQRDATKYEVLSTAGIFAVA
mmetsp:Transcript_187/g.486  ORF Transcript_187/g.486 Transcript_187/m.486 type:complete len:103 (+) Transcript_187:309-617(+)